MALTAEQTELRRRGIGSSEIAAIAGVHPLEGPMSVWLRHMGKAEFTGNIHTELGDAFEEKIAELAVKRLRPVRWAKGVTHVHESEPAVATPDYYLQFADDEEAILECKHVGFEIAMQHWAGGARLPEYTRIQTTWQMGVTGIGRAHVAAVLAGREFSMFTVDADPDYFGDLLDIARKFWRDHIVTGAGPPVDGSRATAEYLAKKYPGGAGVLKADARLEDLAAELRESRKKAKAAEAAKALVENRIREAMGDHDALQLADGQQITNRTAKGGIAYAALVQALGVTDEEKEKFRLAGGKRLRCPPGWGED